MYRYKMTYIEKNGDEITRHFRTNGEQMDSVFHGMDCRGGYQQVVRWWKVADGDWTPLHEPKDMI